MHITRADACCAVSVESPRVSGASPPFAAGRPRRDMTCPAALHRHLRTEPVSTQRTRRGSLHPGLVCWNASHLPHASACQSLPCTSGQGSQGAKRYGSAGEPFNSHARMRTAMCAEWLDPSRGCVRAHTCTCRYEQADLGTAAEYLRSRRDPGSICLWRAWLAGPSCSHGTQVLGVRDGGMAGVMAIVSIIRMLRPYRPTSRTFR